MPLRQAMETRQIWIYFGAVLLAAATGLLVPGTVHLEAWINPALAVMLFVTFLQVPLADLGRTMLDLRFLLALLAANFVAVPLLVLGLVQLFPLEPLMRLGVLIVLLAPCIDYVVTFAHLGRADAARLLAATPLLLLAQMLALPLYLGLFLGDEAQGLVHARPFIEAFAWLIAVPLSVAFVLTQVARRVALAERLNAALGILPVPATAIVLFVVVAAMVPQLGRALNDVLPALPVYLAFAAVAPLLGWLVARAARLAPASGRALAFSAATRNSLVVLPLALAIPGAMPLLPAVIVAQTMVELLSELVYVRLIPRLGAARHP